VKEAVQVSIILPARNEAQNIEPCLRSLLQQSGDFEIIVVNDESTDETEKLAAEMAGSDERIRLVNAPPLPPGWIGKNHAAWLGAKVARGEWFLFTDADTRHHPDALQWGLKRAEEAEASLVSISPDQKMVTWSEKALLPVIYSFLARRYPYEEVNDPSSPVAAASGQYLLIERAVYEAVGGHEAIRGEILEDVALAKLVKQSRRKIRFTREKGVTETRMYRSFGELWRGWTKNLFLLLDRSGTDTLGELVEIAVLDLLPLLVAALGAINRTFDWWFWLAVALLGWRHSLHWRRLRTNRYPISSIFYYELGSFLFAFLLLKSWLQYARGNGVEWKERTYSTD
jgi:glycosyltransferase involved in cell wall biosynthesis